MTPRIMDSAGGEKLRLRRSFSPPPFSQTAVISNVAKRNEKSIMRQFELHPKNQQILFIQNKTLFLQKCKRVFESKKVKK